MTEYSVSLSEEEEKALLTDMLSIQEWLENAIHNKARRCVDMVCHQALSEVGEIILTNAEKQVIVSELVKEGRIISTVKQMPEAIKRQIVRMARVKSAEERQEELDASERVT